MPLKILIVGAGICGQALAILLQNTDLQHDITIMERSASLRAAGQQIDVKSHGIRVLQRIGLLDAVKSRCVGETGLEIMNPDGKAVARFGVSPSSERRPTLTSEFEIMRGDLVNLLYETCNSQNGKLETYGRKERNLSYEFGNTITQLAQGTSGVHATFLDGQQKLYDLVVAADGQGSWTRRLAFGKEADDAAFQSLGVHAAYYSIPRIDGEGGHARAYHASGRRLILTRTGNRPVTQVLLFTMENTELLRKTYQATLKKQKEAFAQTFKNAGWQTDRLLGELDLSGDFYANELAQIKMKQLYSGKVVLLGDAGYSPSPFTGMGTTGALVGAYVLAGELTRHSNDVGRALKAYDEIMRQPIEEYQRLPSAVLRAFFPSSHVGVRLLRNFFWAFSKAEHIIYRPRQEEKSNWNLPEYPELRLSS